MRAEQTYEYGSSANHQPQESAETPIRRTLEISPAARMLAQAILTSYDGLTPEQRASEEVKGSSHGYGGNSIDSHLAINRDDG